MQRRQRTHILIEGRNSLSEQLAAQVQQQYEVEILQQPEHVLTMIEMRETAKQSKFFLGEVLVTRATVEVAGQFGTGIIKGHNAAQATELAIIDAAYNAKLPLCEMWTALLLEEQRAIEERQLVRAARIMETKVDFSTMEE